jgi:hypothetical protein
LQSDAFEPACITVTATPALAAVSAAEQPATPDPMISNLSSRLDDDDCVDDGLPPRTPRRVTKLRRIANDAPPSFAAIVAAPSSLLPL